MQSKLLRSSYLLVSMRLIYRCLGLFSTLILARLLVPEDFGIIAIAALFIFFFETLSSTGIQQYLVQKESVDKEDANSAWTLDIMIKGGMAFLCLCISPLIGQFYENQQIGDAIAILTLSIIFRALMNPGLHILRRNLEYGLIFKVNVLQKVIAVIVVISIAYFYKSFWAMVAGDIASALIGLILSYYYCDFRPKLSTKRIKEQWSFSKWMLSRGFVGYARAQVDIFLVSKLFPLNILGQYNISKEITVMPALDIINPAVEPLIATLSKQRYNLPELSKQFTRALLVILILVSPICFFLFFHAELVIAVILGPKWAGAAPITQALSLMLFAFSVGYILNNLFFALGRVKEIFVYDTLSLTAVVIILLAINFDNIVNFAYWRGGIAIIVTFSFLLFAIKVINCNILQTFITLIIPCITSFVSAYLFTYWNYTNNFMNLVVIGTLFLVFYLSLLFTIALVLKDKNEICLLIYKGYSKYGVKFLNKLRVL